MPPLYQGWRELKAEVRPGRDQATPWLDRLLGAGSTRVVGQAAGAALGAMRRARSEPPPRRPAPQPWRPQRLQAVGAGEGALPRGRKGLIRGLLLAVGLLWGVLSLRPWAGAPGLASDLGALFRPAAPREAAKPKAKPGQQEPAAEAAKAQTEAEAAAVASAQAKALAALPLVPAKGKPLALWQDSEGAWYTADAQGLLAPGQAPGHRDSLGLVVLKGVAARNEPQGQGRRMRLDLPPGALKDLLPLAPGVSSEVQALWLDDPAQPVLVTHDGTRCLLAAEGWALQQERLALVLADLAARGRQAAQIDLRYEDSAVVRPAGR